MRKLALAFISALFVLVPGAASVDAATSTKHSTHKRSDFTPAQREKLMEKARKICKDKYGAMSTVYRLDYYHWKVWCLEN